MKRHRVQHTTTLEARLIEEAKRLRNAAKKLPRGLRRENCLHKTEQHEQACEISQWLSSPETKVSRRFQKMAARALRKSS